MTTATITPIRDIARLEENDTILYSDGSNTYEARVTSAYTSSMSARQYAATAHLESLKTGAFLGAVTNTLFERGGSISRFA